MSLKKLNSNKLYYIGGVVRDEILNTPCLDIDITYEGDAIKFCKSIENEEIEIVQINEDFGTVKLKIDGKYIDIASTRDEYYPRKGHLPVIKDIGCGLKQDVLRRDFTVNAIAKSVMDNKIIDYTNGVSDIKTKTLRVLHDESFIDDPTRILRGLKFRTRFGFGLEPHTLTLQENYLQNVNYDMSYKRLKKEIIETFNLNSQLAYNKFFDEKIYKLLSKDVPKRYSCNIEQLIKKYPVNHVWLVYLGYMNLSNLPLTKQEQKIINDYNALVSESAPKTDFEIYKFFINREMESILLYTITTCSEIGIRYFELSETKLYISGKDLIKLGIKPSKKFEQCFDYILEHKLNKPNMTYDDEINLAKKFFDSNKP